MRSRLALEARRAVLLENLPYPAKLSLVWKLHSIYMINSQVNTITISHQ